MRHADGYLSKTLLGSLGDNRVKCRNGRFAALQREALLTNELGLQEGFESLCLVQFFEDAQLLLTRRLDVWALKLVLEPLALCWVLNVHVLDANRAAV